MKSSWKVNSCPWLDPWLNVDTIPKVGSHGTGLPTRLKFGRHPSDIRVYRAPFTPPQDALMWIENCTYQVRPEPGASWLEAIAKPFAEDLGAQAYPLRF